MKTSRSKLEIEKLPFWKSSPTSPDEWIEKTARLIEDYGGKVMSHMTGTDFRTGVAAFMIIFELEGDIYRVTFPVLKPKSPKDARAASIQAATILYHDIKARLVSSLILGARPVFYGNYLLADGRTLAEIDDPELAVNQLFQLGSGREA